MTIKVTTNDRLPWGNIDIFLLNKPFFYESLGKHDFFRNIVFKCVFLTNDSFQKRDRVSGGIKSWRTSKSLMLKGTIAVESSLDSLLLKIGPEDFVFRGDRGKNIQI